jgi:hypothetical protein
MIATLNRKDLNSLNQAYKSLSGENYFAVNEDGKVNTKIFLKQIYWIPIPTGRYLVDIEKVMKAFGEYEALPIFKKERELNKIRYKKHKV